MVSQGRRRRTKSGPVVDNGGRVGGAAPGRVREGGTPPAQLGGTGERLSSPIGVCGGAPEAIAFCIVNPPKLRKKCNKNTIRIELNSPSIRDTEPLHVTFLI